MILGIGCDIVKIARIKKLLESSSGPRFLERFFTKKDSISIKNVMNKYETNEIELSKALLYSLYFNRVKYENIVCEYFPTNISIDINYLHCDIRLKNFK